MHKRVYSQSVPVSLERTQTVICQHTSTHTCVENVHSEAHKFKRTHSGNNNNNHSTNLHKQQRNNKPNVKYTFDTMDKEQGNTTVGSFHLLLPKKNAFQTVLIFQIYSTSFHCQETHALADWYAMRLFSK